MPEAERLSRMRFRNRDRPAPADHPNPAGAIYGTIVVLAAIGGTAEGTSEAQILTLMLASVVVFWLAHVYCDVIAGRVAGAHDPFGAAVRAAARHERPIIEAATLPAIAIVLGIVGVFERDTAIRVALFAGLLTLFGWGIAHGRAAGLSRPMTFLAAMADAGFGAIIVVLELLLHH